MNKDEKRAFYVTRGYNEQLNKNCKRGKHYPSANIIENVFP
jgi:hypothetical protein